VLHVSLQVSVGNGLERRVKQWMVSMFLHVVVHCSEAAGRYEWARPKAKPSLTGGRTGGLAVGRLILLALVDTHLNNT
jgi:hypothetical protein